MTISKGGHGGTRPGAGRPKVRLADLVAEKRFDPTNQRHRWALEIDRDWMPPTEDLAAVVQRYRTTRSIDFARQFARMVLDD